MRDEGGHSWAEQGLTTGLLSPQFPFIPHPSFLVRYGSAHRPSMDFSARFLVFEPVQKTDAHPELPSLLTNIG